MCFSTEVSVQHRAGQESLVSLPQISAYSQGLVEFALRLHCSCTARVHLTSFAWLHENDTRVIVNITMSCNSVVSYNQCIFVINKICYTYLQFV